MKLEFKTKTDINGNSYYLTIDTDKKTFYLDSSFNGITIAKKDYNQLIKQLRANGFKAVIKLY